MGGISEASRNIRDSGGVQRGMDASANPCEPLWPMVALEASVFFSLPAWFSITYPAWPSSNPGGFAAAVALAAGSAMVFYHVIPALLGRSAARPQGRTSGLVTWLIRAWLVTGAVFSLSGATQFQGLALRAFRYGDANVHLWSLAVIPLMGLVAAAATALATSMRWRKPIGVSCCAFGLVFLIGLFIAQWEGLSERTLIVRDDPEATFWAILPVAAPTAVIGFRIGRSGATARQIWWTGALGVAAAIAVAATLAAFAKVGGANLHWKPSLSIDFTFALVTGWTDVRATQVLWAAAGLTGFGLCVVSATWLAEAVANWQFKWRREVAIAAAAGCAVAREGFQGPYAFESPYFQFWAWTVLLGGATAFACLRRPR